VPQFALFIDEDSCDARFIAELRRLGFDVVTVYELGRASFADESHVEFATQEDRLIVTANDHDFRRIQGEWGHAGRSHPGMLIWSQERWKSPEGLARRIAEVAGEFDSDSLRDAVFYL
jgi:hypothetical protein